METTGFCNFPPELGFVNCHHKVTALHPSHSTKVIKWWLQSHCMNVLFSAEFLLILSCFFQLSQTLKLTLFLKVLESPKLQSWPAVILKVPHINWQVKERPPDLINPQIQTDVLVSSCTCTLDRETEKVHLNVCILCVYARVYLCPSVCVSGFWSFMSEVDIGTYPWWLTLYFVHEDCSYVRCIIYTLININIYLHL